MPLPSDDATIILTARNADAGRAACAALVADSKATADASWLGRWWGGTGPPLRREPSFHQLDIDDAASIEALAAHLRDEYGGVDCVINNAGMAYGMASDVAFPEQAERTVAVNYFGTRAMCRAMLPILKPRGRLVQVSSRAGQWAGAKKDALNALTAAGGDGDGGGGGGGDGPAQLDALMRAFVASAAAGTHKADGWPGSAYGASKAGVTALSRLLATREASVTACCPGFCRTSMTQKEGGGVVSALFYVLGYVVGRSAHAGADTPVWLATRPWEEACSSDNNGKFFSGRKVVAGGFLG